MTSLKEEISNETLFLRKKNEGVCSVFICVINEPYTLNVFIFVCSLISISQEKTTSSRTV